MQARTRHTDDTVNDNDHRTTAVMPPASALHVDALNALVKGAEMIAYENSSPRSDSYSNGTSRPRPNSAESFDSIERFLPEIAEAVTRPPINPLRPNSPIRILKRYEGFITSVLSESFLATIWEQGKEWPRLEAEFSTDSIEHNDQELVQTNAPIFVMALEFKFAGDHWAKTSQVRFRRVLPVGRAEVEVAYSTITTDLRVFNNVPWDQRTIKG